MPVNRSLIRRSGDLKRALLAFAREPRFEHALRQANEERFGAIGVGEEGERGNFLDYFLLQRRLDDGRTLVDYFVAAHPELPEAERAMLLGWQDVVEGVFVVQRLDNDALVVVNLIDDLTYRVHSNMGPRVFAPMPAGSFLIGRLTPVGDEWLVSGYLRTAPAANRADVYRIAADLAARHPSLVFRNPTRLEQAWEMQREERASFITFFGADLVVLPGHAVDERMRAYGHFRMYEERDAEGRSAAERAAQAYGAVPPQPELELPDELVEAETVGLIYDEVDGLNFLADFGLIQEAFAHPESTSDRRHREAALSYLEDSSISPRLLRRLAEQDPQRASRLFQRLLKQPHFSWEQDGEALLRRYKADYFAHPVLPSITPISEGLAQAHITAGSAAAAIPAPAAHRPGRNDPCPCGSGKKYKKCCGR